MILWIPVCGSVGSVGTGCSTSVSSVCKCNDKVEFHCGHLDSSDNQDGPFVQSEVDSAVLLVPLVKRSAGLSPLGQ